MNKPLRRATSRTVRGVMRGLPGPVVQRLVEVWAPLARYGGASRGGAAALARAISILAEPPLPLHGARRSMATEEIAERLGRSAEEVERWARLGLLGEPEPPGEAGRAAVWGPAQVERARLIDYLRHHGISEDEIREAEAQRRLPLLAIDRTVAGRATMTLAEVSRRTGVSPEFTLQVWRALACRPATPTRWSTPAATSRACASSPPCAPSSRTPTWSRPPRCWA
jgi:hypothetical protein